MTQRCNPYRGVAKNRREGGQGMIAVSL